MATAERTHFVYRAFDADERLLYIGCTKNLAQRRRAHAGGVDSDWYPYATRFRITGPYEKSVALEIEACAIESEHSYFNATGNDRRIWQRWHQAYRGLYEEMRRGRVFEDEDGRLIPDVVLAFGREVEREARKVAQYPDYRDGRLRRYLDAVRQGLIPREVAA